MKWFTEVFLPSLEKRMNNPKYPNQLILSDKQYDVCLRYMNDKQCHGFYGWFTIYEIEVDNIQYTVTDRGRYHFLSKRILNK